jgi:hypothetical protein
MGSGEVIYSTTQSASTLEEKLSATKCESGDVEVQWNNIKKCMLDTVSYLVGKVDRKARKSWITQEIINKMDE